MLTVLIIILFIWFIIGLWRWKATRLFRPRWYEDIILMIANIILAPFLIVIFATRWWQHGRHFRRFKK